VLKHLTYYASNLYWRGEETGKEEEMNLHGKYPGLEAQFYC
jgi:hypothetical protein